MGLDVNLLQTIHNLFHHIYNSVICVYKSIVIHIRLTYWRITHQDVENSD